MLRSVKVRSKLVNIAQGLKYMWAFSRWHMASIHVCHEGQVQVKHNSLLGHLIVFVFFSVQNTCTFCILPSKLLLDLFSFSKTCLLDQLNKIFSFLPLWNCYKSNYFCRQKFWNCLPSMLQELLFEVTKWNLQFESVVLTVPSTWIWKTLNYMYSLSWTYFSNSSFLMQCSIHVYVYDEISQGNLKFSIWMTCMLIMILIHVV